MKNSINDPLETFVIVELYRRHIGLLFKYGGAALVLVVGISLIMPQTFHSGASLLPPDTGGSASGNLASLLSAAPITLAAAGADAKSAMLFTELLKSRTLRERVIDSLELEKSSLYSNMRRSDILNKLEKNTTIEIFKTGKVTIEVDVATSWFPNGDEVDSAREMSAKIANACMEELDRMNRETTTARARRTKAYLEKVIAQTLSILTVLQDSLQNFQQDNNVIGLKEQLEIMASNASAIGSELAKERLGLALLKQEFQASASPVVLQQRKVETLELQYAMVQKGGIASNDGLSIPAEKLPGLSRAYLNLVRDLKTNEQVLAYLQSQRMQEVVQEVKDVPTIVSLDTAIPPETRTSPARVLMVIMTLAGAVVLYLIIVPLASSYKRQFVNSQTM